jgi:hypothetical protein
LGFVASGLNAFAQAVCKKAKGIQETRLPATVRADEAAQGRQGLTLSIARLAETHIGKGFVILNSQTE